MLPQRQSRSPVAAIRYAVLSAAVFIGCASNPRLARYAGGAPEPVKHDLPSHNAETPRGRSETGVASYYGREFAGRRTASGERFNPAAMTAAHRTLPFGARVRVTNLGNGKSVVVRINDRGPHTKSRIIDLSAGAAQEIGMIAAGTARVRIEVVK